jgi:hypothetical protein
LKSGHFGTFFLPKNPLNESDWILFFWGSTIDENSQTHKKFIKNLNLNLKKKKKKKKSS